MSGYKVEKPEIISSHWKKVFELDLEMRQTARLISHISRNHELPRGIDGAPMVQRFLSNEESEFEGISLGRVNNSLCDISLVMVLSDKIDTATIRDDPAFAVAVASSSRADIETYDLASVYRLWVTHKINPEVAFKEVQNLFSSLVDHLVSQELYVPNVIKHHSRLIHGVDLNPSVWIGSPN